MANEKYLWKCLQNNCSKEFKHLSCRSRHQKTCKKGDILKPKTPTECPNVWCKKSFSSLFNLKRYLLICKPKGKSNHICSEPGCNKSFNKLSRLLHHQSSHKKQTFTCDLCFTSYVWKDKFLIHKKSVNNLKMKLKFWITSQPWLILWMNHYASLFSEKPGTWITKSTGKFFHWYVKKYSMYILIDD